MNSNETINKKIVNFDGKTLNLNKIIVSRGKVFFKKQFTNQKLINYFKKRFEGPTKENQIFYISFKKMMKSWDFSKEIGKFKDEGEDDFFLVKLFFDKLLENCKENIEKKGITLDEDDYMGIYHWLQEELYLGQEAGKNHGIRGIDSVDLNKEKADIIKEWLKEGKEKRRWKFFEDHKNLKEGEKKRNSFLLNLETGSLISSSDLIDEDFLKSIETKNDFVLTKTDENKEIKEAIIFVEGCEIAYNTKLITKIMRKILQGSVLNTKIVFLKPPKINFRDYEVTERSIKKKKFPDEIVEKFTRSEERDYWFNVVRFGEDDSRFLYEKGVWPLKIIELKNKKKENKAERIRRWIDNDYSSCERSNHEGLFGVTAIDKSQLERSVQYLEEVIRRLNNEKIENVHLIGMDWQSSAVALTCAWNTNLRVKSLLCFHGFSPDILLEKKILSREKINPNLESIFFPYSRGIINDTQTWVEIRVLPEVTSYTSYRLSGIALEEGRKIDITHRNIYTDNGLSEYWLIDFLKKNNVKFKKEEKIKSLHSTTLIFSFFFFFPVIVFLLLKIVNWIERKKKISVLWTIL